jgi:dihydroorotate dehydrogenase electron transfer subunit
MKQFAAVIENNSKIADHLYSLTFTWPPEQTPPLPGQFLTFRIGSTSVPLLRRPFAFSRFSHEEGSASIIYLVRGTATEILSRMKAGERLDTIAPLGTPFPENTRAERIICAAGGIGIGPILYLCSHMRRNGRDPLLIVGARTAAALPGPEAFNGIQPVFCTDDGSRGFHGTVVDYLREEDPEPGTTLYCCGPDAMLEACGMLAAEKTLDCWVSLEQTMGCAVGACMGCVVKMKGKEQFARVCTEGPVFKSDEVVWTSR